MSTHLPALWGYDLKTWTSSTIFLHSFLFCVCSSISSRGLCERLVSSHRTILSSFCNHEAALLTVLWKLYQQAFSPHLPASSIDSGRKTRLNAHLFWGVLGFSVFPQTGPYIDLRIFLLGLLRIFSLCFVYDLPQCVILLNFNGFWVLGFLNVLYTILISFKCFSCLAVITTPRCCVSLLYTGTLYAIIIFGQGSTNCVFQR